MFAAMCLSVFRCIGISSRTCSGVASPGGSVCQPGLWRAGRRVVPASPQDTWAERQAHAEVLKAWLGVAATSDVAANLVHWPF